MTTAAAATPAAADDKPIPLYIGYSSTVVGAYRKPLDQAMAVDRVFKFPRNKATVRQAQAMAAAIDLLDAVEHAKDYLCRENFDPTQRHAVAAVLEAALSKAAAPK